MLGASLSDILYRNEGCQTTKFPIFFQDREDWQEHLSTTKLPVNKSVSFSFPFPHLRREGVKVASFREVGDGVSDGELADCASVSVSVSGPVSVADSVCFSARVFDLAASPDSESAQFIPFRFRFSNLLLGVSQTLSFSGASCTLLREQPNTARERVDASQVGGQEDASEGSA